MALTPPAPHSINVQPNARSEPLFYAPERKRSRTRHDVLNQVQDTVVSNNNKLSKYVNRDSDLLTELGWEQVVRSRRARGDMGRIQELHHPTQRFL
jgi:hypothetical protein